MGSYEKALAMNSTPDNNRLINHIRLSLKAVHLRSLFLGRAFHLWAGLALLRRFNPRFAHLPLGPTHALLPLRSCPRGLSCDLLLWGGSLYLALAACCRGFLNWTSFLLKLWLGLWFELRFGSSCRELALAPALHFLKLLLIPALRFRELTFAPALRFR